ncbi:MAG: hypothetical protein JWM35_1845 [Verrucomicrobia bacterium]|nr:hypothetical protein [Verrucomicrobiota bacterium]
MFPAGFSFQYHSMTPDLTYRDNFIEALAELHDAETRLLEVLPILASSAVHPELKATFKTHLAQTRAQTERLEQIIAELGEPPLAPATEAVSLIIAGARASITHTIDPDARDAWLISAAQHIERHAISVYGRARTYARLLGLERANELLYASLHETALASIQLSDLSTWLGAQTRAVSSA